MTTNFDITPPDEELTELTRDLRFYPAKPENAKTMTAAQVEQFNQDGYLKPFRIFEEEEITGIREYFDRLLEETLAAGKDSYSISTAHLRYGQVYDLLTDSRIVNLVKDLLGENVIAWGSHFFCKMPHDGKQVAWHQDASYWPLTPSKAVTVWLAIDDADCENACMRFIAGSHHHGHLTYRPADTSEHSVLNQSIENPLQYGELVNDELQAGEISLHSDLLLHGSEANNSDRRRCGLTLRYCTADVRAGMSWNQKGVIVSGEDPSGHWANAKRPLNNWTGCEMPDPIPLDSFREMMLEWEDWDVAEYKLAICLGMLPPDNGRYDNFRKYKHIWGSHNRTGSFLSSTLKSLVKLGTLEFDDEEQRFRWKENFSFDSLDDG